MKKPYLDELSDDPPSTVGELTFEHGTRTQTPLEQLLAAVRGTTTTLSAESEARNRQTLTEYYDRDICPPDIDYDRYAYSFIAKYFWKNVYKYFEVLRREDPAPPDRVADLGAGSGAATVACIAWLVDTYSPSEISLRIELVDRSEQQLALAREVLNAADGALDELDLSYTTRCTDITAMDADSEDVDLVFLGHVLGENYDTVAPLLDRALDRTQADGTIYAVERTDDRVWTNIEQVLAKKPIHSRTKSLAVEQGANLAPLPSVEFDSLSMKYVVLDMPASRRLYETLDQYFQAWRDQSVTALRSVFASDATYSERPFAPRLEGRDEIEAYWREEVVPQQEPRIEILDVAYQERTAFVEWRARFGLSEIKERTVQGIIHAELDEKSNKIGSFREYFETRDVR